MLVGGVVPTVLLSNGFRICEAWCAPLTSDVVILVVCTQPGEIVRVCDVLSSALLGWAE